VFHDRKSFDTRTAVKGRSGERASFVGAGAASGVHRSQSVEKGRAHHAGFEACASVERILENVLISVANNRRRRAVREKLGAELEADDERDRERPTSEDDLRKNMAEN
jgi:hypothetical protein